MGKLIKTLTFKTGEETRSVKLNKDSYKDNLLSAQINKTLNLIEEFRKMSEMTWETSL